MLLYGGIFLPHHKIAIAISALKRLSRESKVSWKYNCDSLHMYHDTFCGNAQSCHEIARYSYHNIINNYHDN